MQESLSTGLIIRWYEKYRDDLLRVRKEQEHLHRRSGYFGNHHPGLLDQLKSGFRRARAFLENRALLKPQLDDIEAELSYMRLREIRPATVVEISPCGGWSTTWILQALRDNGIGHLYSFDMVSLAPRNVPKELSAGRWTFSQGDARQAVLPTRIDYLFLDSEHSATFAKWYIEVLFPRLAPDTPVSVHDIFHTSEADGFSDEGKELLDWFGASGLEYFTASAAAAPDVFSKINQKKTQLGLDKSIHKDAYNSMVFFRNPGLQSHAEI